MDNDDILQGRVLTRREVLALMGAAGLALVVGCSDDDADPAATSTAAPAQENTATAAATSAATEQASATAVPSCVVRPELTEGPYFVDVNLNRSDIRPNTPDGAVSAGDPLALTFLVSRIGGDGACTALEGATVDAWQCDALGVYSGVAGSPDTDFLRGHQLTDASGRAAFTTVYPGWYPGRATHIHFKIRTDPAADAGTEFTSQLFFDDALSDTVHTQGVYASRGAAGRRQNSDDGIYNDTNGQLLLDVQRSGQSYAATFEIGIQLDG